MDRPAEPDRPLLRRWRPVLAAGIAVAGWTVLGGWPGLVLGCGGAVAGWRAVGALEAPGVARRRTEIDRDQATAVHLLGACLRAGATVPGALETVADALPGVLAEELRRIRRRLELGIPPAEVWRDVAAGRDLPSLGRALGRAHESGAPVGPAIEQLARELNELARARAAAAARTVEVRAAAPLGLCFLPAFVLLGVVPLVVGLFADLHLFG